MKRDVEIAISYERSVESVTSIGYIQMPCGKLGALLVKMAVGNMSWMQNESRGRVCWDPPGISPLFLFMCVF